MKPDRALRTSRAHRAGCTIETRDTLRADRSLRARCTCSTRRSVISRSALRTSVTDRADCAGSAGRTSGANGALCTVISGQTLRADRALCTCRTGSAGRALRARRTLRAWNAIQCVLRNGCRGDRLTWQDAAADAHFQVHLGAGEAARIGQIDAENTVHDGIVRLADRGTKLVATRGRIPQREGQVEVAIHQHSVLLDLALIDKIRQLGGSRCGKRRGCRTGTEDNGNGENKISGFHGVQFPCWASKPFWKIRSEMMVCWRAATTA